MDLWDKQLPEHPHAGARHRRQNPSFSSSLLDAIYRSIDEPNAVQREEQVILYTETMRKKQSIDDEIEDDRLNFRRACMIEKWMEKKVSEKVVVRRTSMADFDRKARNVRDRDFKKLMNSSSSSSDSSSGGGFSSSESETRSSSYTMQRPRPIRTEKPHFEGYGDGIKVSIPNQKPKHESSFVKTKSKALKIYGDLKKVKQPISPGGRLATFLNSLFNGGSPKKQKFTNSVKQNDACMRKSKSAQGSTCSSASSFSRSCLSKTPSSGEKLINSGSTKRSVRFCPVSVILDEDSRPCGHKSLQDELGLMAAATTLRNALRNDHCRAEEASEDVMMNMNSYQKKINGDVYINREEDEDEDEEEEDDDDDEDALSCSSSDLFELDNLSSIGIERYREELPVYETTHFNTNQAIANGLIL
ncbi:protein BIG GRAIN 1-like B [Benincasa hispida]|uniref:protein BIG GRAIN 1-like B n=1 Tax=Benincasa hispida TaxID=102211 RepID=UPI00190242C7|nr:protein BIG GRAIN 1-like B [Benincasa hispida]